MGHNSTKDPRAMIRSLFDLTDDDAMTDYGRTIAREQRWQNPEMIQPGYFMVRARKRYPQLPAKIWWSEYEGRRVLMAEVADEPGKRADPIGVHAAVVGPLKPRDGLSIEDTYLFYIDEIRWARAHATTDPAARHQRRVDLTFIDPIAPPER